MWVINSYHGNTDWIKEYTDDVVFYDKKDLNVGSNIYDYMDYIVKNYDNLPEIILFGKSNMLERHITKEEFNSILESCYPFHDDPFCFDVNEPIPLLTQTHTLTPGISYYKDGLYYEINNSWYVNEHPSKLYQSYNQYARDFDLPTPEYLAFSPGGCWIVPRENILKRTKEYYQRLRDLVSYDVNPAEAHMVERSLFYIWS